LGLALRQLADQHLRPKDNSVSTRSSPWLSFSAAWVPVLPVVALHSQHRRSGAIAAPKYESRSNREANRIARARGLAEQCGGEHHNGRRRTAFPKGSHFVLGWVCAIYRRTLQVHSSAPTKCPLPACMPRSSPLCNATSPAHHTSFTIHCSPRTLPKPWLPLLR
jgi:hypothetical protein